MLRRLFKHEMNATARLLLPLYFVLLALTIMERIVIGLDFFEGVLIIIPGFISFAYIVANIAIVVLSSVIVIYRFYKNLITDEGYLMFTLPVKSHQLINSKLIVSTIWTLASFCVIVASILIAFGNQKFIWDAINTIKEEFAFAFGSNVTPFVVEMIGILIVGSLSSILLIYASIALGQLFKGHKILGSIVSYIALYTVMEIIIVAITVPICILSDQSLSDVSVITSMIYPLTIVLSIIFSIIFYCITINTFKNKLNLD